MTKKPAHFQLSWWRRILSLGRFSLHSEDGADCCHVNGEYLSACSFISRLKKQGCPTHLFCAFFVYAMQKVVKYSRVVTVVDFLPCSHAGSCRLPKLYWFAWHFGWWMYVYIKSERTLVSVFLIYVVYWYIEYICLSDNIFLYILIFCVLI